MNWHALSEKEVLGKLQSSKAGLSEEEAAIRLREYGQNKLKERKKVKAITMFLQEFNSLLIYILIIAALVSAFLSHWIDFYVIFAIVFLNSTLGFFQHYKAEKAIQKLKQILVPKAKVLRQGKLKEISSSLLVPGDVLVLSEGDKIMADARLFACENLQVNEAVLIGESMPSEKFTRPLPTETALADRENMLYCGTTIVRGNGKAIITETGMHSEFGKIAESIQTVKPETTPLQKKINIFSKKLGIIILVLCAAITFFGILAGLGKLDMFLTGIALAVAAIPEGLPAVITICLAFTVQRMYKVKALVRKLPAAETLGCATIILADKTGTITAEQMTVTKAYCNNQIFDIEKIKKLKDKTSELLFRIGCLCNNARLEKDKDKEYLIGDPTEKALLMAAKRFDLDKRKLTKAEPRVIEFPFSSERKLMSIVRQSKEGITSYVKGAPDVLLKRCTKEFVSGRIIELTEERRKQLHRIYENMASSALRVLAFAFKPLSPIKAKSQNAAEYNLIFVGFQGMFDPPRKGVKEAVEQCKNAGIKVVMITGDSSLTAKAVAKQIGLHGLVVRAEKLEKMKDEELTNILDKVVVFARVTPQHKLRIVNAFKERNEIVAVTGDGVNDALALKRADIGIAMGIRGTDVTRDTSDIILLDDNFASIVKGTKEGRRAYDNIKKFVKFLLSANSSELAVILFAIFARMPLPLLPLQILWLNLVTDSLPALALSTEPAEKDVMQRKPRKKEEGILTGTIAFIVIAGILGLIVTIILFYFALPEIAKARTMALTVMVFFELFLVFTCRSKYNIKKIGFFSNKFLVYSVIIAAALHLITLYTPLSTAFSFVPLCLTDWAKIIPLAALGLIFFEIGKLISKK